jgi:hypothetical protein
MVRRQSTGTSRLSSAGKRCALCRRIYDPVLLKLCSYAPKPGAHILVHACPECQARNRPKPIATSASSGSKPPARSRKSAAGKPTKGPRFCYSCNREFPSYKLVPMSYLQSTGTPIYVGVCIPCSTARSCVFTSLGPVARWKARQRLDLPAVICDLCNRETDSDEIVPMGYRHPKGKGRVIHVVVCATCRRTRSSVLVSLDPAASRLANRRAVQSVTAKRRVPRLWVGEGGRAKPKRVTGIVSGGLPGLGRRR